MSTTRVILDSAFAVATRLWLGVCSTLLPTSKTGATPILPADVDPGLRDCLQAGKHCNGYGIMLAVQRNRLGHLQGWGDHSLLLNR